MKVEVKDLVLAPVIDLCCSTKYFKICDQKTPPSVKVSLGNTYVPLLLPTAREEHPTQLKGERDVYMCDES
jgi:hypothetical protein